MSKLSGTVKRKAKKDKIEQLETHLARGKDMVYRLSLELEATRNMMRQREAQLRASQSIIGALVCTFGEGKEVEVTKAMIKEVNEKYVISSVESEDKLSFIIKIEEVPKNEDEQRAVEAVSNEGQDGTGESVGDTSTNTEAKQVQEL